ncbi:methyl-CpG-binding domain-containing protein 9 [Dorcoceras hygrometricum]|uniref:Methyl-CpG-binding domain-containing protein 9 n=1 Tax=Dorcoceras hygrometricum TaxID=472368 RepID=A0A2Z7CVA7_9LAMI|nr:methyl-CpG-binding domain-containing protein 9 [Dorcoceras hygrometricum]
MTGDGIPSSACTRRPDEICTDGSSSSRLVGNDFPAARGDGRGGDGFMRRGGAALNNARSWTGPTGRGPKHEHYLHPYHRDFIVTPITDQIGPIDSVSKTEHYDLKNYFSEPQCKMTILPLNVGKSRFDPGIQLAVGPQPLWLWNHNPGLAQRIMIRASSNIAP